MTAGDARTDALRRAPRARAGLPASAAVQRAGSAAAVEAVGSAAAGQRTGVASAAVQRAGSPAATHAGQSPSALATAGVSVRIDRLVIDGPRLDPLQSAQLRTALELELGALLQGDPISASARSQDHGRFPPLSAGASDAAGLGRAIARSLHAGLAGPGLGTE